MQFVTFLTINGAADILCGLVTYLMLFVDIMVKR